MTNLFLNKAKKCLFFAKISLASVANFINYQNISLAAPISINNYDVAINQRYELRAKGCYHGKLQLKKEIEQQNLPGYRTEPKYRCMGTHYEPPLTALIPEELLIKTIQESPTFLWYVPYSSIKEAEFTLVKDFKFKDLLNPSCPQCFNVDLMDLRDFQRLGQVVYHTTVPLTGIPGVMRFTLPSTQGLPTLESGQSYFWQLKLIPEEYKNSPVPELPLPVVTGWIQRINPDLDLRSQLNQASLQERTTIYAKAEMWNDALTNLAELSCSNNSQKLGDEWQSALKALKLENLTNKPLVNCSKIEK
jgi:hypothetical protein